MLFLFLILHNTKVIETQTDIGFKDVNDLSFATFERAKATSEGIELRSSADGGSLLNISKENPVDHWSFDFTINNLEISYPQSAGFYLWYTDKPVENGVFMGGSGAFTGLMVGVEFLGKNISLILSTNDGTGDYSNIEDTDTITYRDSINPERFRNVKEFRFKVISTDKNFKVEIYDKDKLLYDSFRHLRDDKLADLSKGKYFSITTEYDRVLHNKHFLLKSVRLYERVEDDEYDRFAIKADEPKSTPRFYEHIEHSSREIQHIVSLIEHVMKYTKEHIGKASSSPIFTGLSNARNEIENLSKNIETLVTDYNAKKEGPNDTVIGVVEKFATLEDKMKYMQESLDQVKAFLLNYDDRQSTKSGWIIKLVLIGASCVGFIYAVKMFVKRRKY